MTYIDEYRAQVAALETTLARERTRRRVRATCVTCRQPESACECNPTPPEPEYLSGHAADVVAGRNYPTL